MAPSAIFDRGPLGFGRPLFAGAAEARGPLRPLTTACLGRHIQISPDTGPPSHSARNHRQSRIEKMQNGPIQKKSFLDKFVFPLENENGMKPISSVLLCSRQENANPKISLMCFEHHISCFSSLWPNPGCASLYSITHLRSEGNSQHIATPDPLSCVNEALFAHTQTQITWTGNWLREKLVNKSKDLWILQPQPTA